MCVTTSQLVSVTTRPRTRAAPGPALRSVIRLALARGAANYTEIHTNESACTRARREDVVGSAARRTWHHGAARSPARSRTRLLNERRIAGSGQTDTARLDSARGMLRLVRRSLALDSKRTQLPRLSSPRRGLSPAEPRASALRCDPRLVHRASPEAPAESRLRVSPHPPAGAPPSSGSSSCASSPSPPHWELSTRAS